MIKPYPFVLKGIIAFFSLLKKPILILLLSIIVTNALAQQQKPTVYSLLWKISGKGLTKPSYIFGTMHVKDKRAFGFSDSVMLAIQSCPSFALEIHPDTLIKQMFNTLKDKDSNNSLRKLLTKAEYDELAKRFEAKNGFPMGDIDPIQAESMMQPVKDKPDDKKTFVDAYLFGVARGMNKNIYGLENTVDHFKGYGEISKIKSRLQDMLEEDEEDGIEETEEMTGIYSTGNLKEILNYLGDERLDDSILIARNNVMSNSIQMRMAVQPIFSAVGVAHLPGDNGLISLLRNAGYIVTLVTANFTGVANNFNTDYTKLKWKTYTDEVQGYSVDFPFEPIKTNPSYEVTAVIYPDMANDMFFGTYAILKGSKTKATADIAIAQVIKNLKNKQDRILSNKVIWANGLKATEIIVQNKKHNTIRYRLFVNNNFLYCIYAGNDMASVNLPYANRFFDSFKSFKPSIKPDKKWVTFKNDTAAFSISLPMQPVVVKQKIPSPQNPETTFELNMYVATDSVNLINYLIRYNDYPKGMYMGDKDKAFDVIGTELKTKGAILHKSRQISLEGYEGREIDFSIKGYNCRAQFFVRGNRLYLLLKQNLGGDDINKGFDFFKTFKFTPYLKAPLETYALKNGNYKAKTFQATTAPTDSSKTYTSFLRVGETVFSTNTLTGGVFGFEHATISEFYRAPSIDSVYKTLLKQLVNYSDTLLKDDTIIVNGLKGHEYLTQNKKTKEKERYRMFINNADVLSFMSHASGEELFTDASNEFYSSLVQTHKTPQISLSTSKAELITNSLLSKDSTTYSYAHGALSYYKFDKDELPYLLSALQKSYPDDTTENGARIKLVKALVDIKDEKSLDVLVKVFNTTTSDYLKASILGATVNVDAKKGYETYLDLLTKSPVLNNDVTYQVFRPLYDSIEYVAANYSRILPLLKHPEYRRTLLSITESLLGQKYKSKYSPLVKKHFNELTQYATDELNKYLSDTSDNKWTHGIYNYLQLMGKIKGEPITESFTSTVIKKDTYNGEISDAVITRLDNGLPVSQMVTNRLLDSIGFRYDILEALNKNGKLTVAPIKYRSQQEFAKAALYKYIVDQDEGSADNIKLLGIIPEKDSRYYVFKFNSAYDTDAHYTAVCGPYKTGSTKLDFSIYRSYTDWEDTKSDWKIHAKKLIPKLKEANTEDLKNKQD
jgi:uncharacterized protein YbaP (TraB family)